MPIPLYIHVPFCRGKCGYCTFHSRSDFTVDEQNLYTEKLIEQIDYFMNKTGQSRFKTVYLGGGTPSLLPVPLLERIFSHLAFHIGSWTEECTIECNPEDINDDFLNFLNNSPVDRISLGVQSFQENVLRASGRAVSQGQIRKAVELIGRSWRNRFSIDLITGLPAQTLKKQESDIYEAINSGVDHISCYSLILENDTPVSVSPVLPDEESEGQMWEMSRNILITEGFSHYEVSNFAKPGCESRHNMEYWRMNPFIGCGPGAVSMVNEGRPVRLINPPDHKLWSAGAGSEWNWEREILEPVDFLFENYMMGLRTSEGINRKRFKKRFGHEPEFFIPSILAGKDNSSFVRTENSLSLTENGRLFMNPLLIKIGEELDSSEINFTVTWP